MKIQTTKQIKIKRKKRASLKALRQAGFDRIAPSVYRSKSTKEIKRIDSLGRVVKASKKMGESR